MAPAEPLGRVISVNGSQAIIRLRPPGGSWTPDARVTVGKFLGIRTGQGLVIGVLTKISTDAADAQQGGHATGQLDLLGEIRTDGRNGAYFDRGVKEYPTIGDAADLIAHRDLRLVFDVSGSDTINIGHLQQDEAIGAYVKVDDLVRKHFAVFGPHPAANPRRTARPAHLPD